MKRFGLLVGLVMGCSSSLSPGNTGGNGGSPAGTGGGSGGIRLVQDGGSPGSRGGTGGAAGQPQEPVDASADGGLCPDYFYQIDGHPTYGACCPDPAPDCSGQPDGAAGVPGLTNPDGSVVLTCVDRHNGFCSCNCYSGRWSCGC